MSRFLLAVLLLGHPILSWSQGESAPDVLGRLEARLLEARHIRIEASIQATGAVQASLQGHTELREGNRAQHRYTGTFAGKPVALSLASDGRLLELANVGQARTLYVGQASNRALLLGFTRMGLLHNLARGAGLAGPDHADGAIEPWIEADNFRPVTFAQVGEFAGMPSLGFELLVDGQPAAGVQLWLDPDSGLPRRREQTVQFPQGEMKVVETYTRVQVE